MPSHDKVVLRVDIIYVFTMSVNNDYDSTFKILVLGDSGVGKTCLIYRYTAGEFTDAYVSTIGIKASSLSQYFFEIV